MIAEIRAELLDAWERWDERPGLPETAEQFTRAVQGSWPGRETLARELLAAFRRAAWSYDEAIDGTLRALNEEDSG